MPFGAVPSGVDRRHPRGVSSPDRSPPLSPRSSSPPSAGGASAALGDPARPTRRRPAADPAAPRPPATAASAPPAGWPVISGIPVADLSPWQDYRAGLGIAPGLDGAGVRIADVEYEWGATHEELAPRGLAPAAPSGLDAAYPGARPRDGGARASSAPRPTGAASPGSPRVPPCCPPHRSSPAPRRATSRSPRSLRRPTGSGRRRPPDRAPGPGVRDDGCTLLGPIEFYPTVRAAIREAVDRGIVVVEPAGNGGVDVGRWRPDLALRLRGPRSATGALMVGAGGSGFDDPPRARPRAGAGLELRARVDLQGYGAARRHLRVRRPTGDGTDPTSPTPPASTAPPAPARPSRGRSPCSRPRRSRGPARRSPPPRCATCSSRPACPRCRPRATRTPGRRTSGPRPAGRRRGGGPRRRPGAAPVGPDGGAGTPAPVAPAPVAAAPVVAPPAPAGAQAPAAVRAPAVRGLGHPYDRRARRLVVTPARRSRRGRSCEVGGRRGRASRPAPWCSAASAPVRSWCG